MNRPASDAWRNLPVYREPWKFPNGSRSAFLMLRQAERHHERQMNCFVATGVGRRRCAVLVALMLLLEMRLDLRAEDARIKPTDRIRSQQLSFKPGTNGEFHFDTGLLRGNLRTGGKSLGLSSVVHIPSGIILDRSMGLFSHYRVFTTNKRYGHGAWDWPSTAKLRADGAVEVQWPAADDRPFAMSAVYRWRDARTLDLDTIVTAAQALPNFEVFLASYLHGGFTNSLVFSHSDPARGGKAGFVSAARSSGDWQMFPRDGAAVSLITDGRWSLEPHPVEWRIQPPFGKALGVRRDPRSGITAVLMAPSADCFAVATPYETEGHYSLYLSLFGREVKAGETVRARARLVIATGLSNERITELYETYLKNL